MTHKQRFEALMNEKKVDRVPIYFFGTWHETKERWQKEGCPGISDNYNIDPGPQVLGMDPDWEDGMWNCHGLVNVDAIGEYKPKILEETDEYYIEKNSIGEIIKYSKLGSTIPLTIEHALKPTRESWEKFKTYFDAKDPSRRSKDWEQKAEKLNREDRLLAFMGGSMYGWLRNFMGVEEISMLMYDDAQLFEEMVNHFTDYFIELYTPVLKKVKFDLVYFFEDCCGATGPLFSPAMYDRFFDNNYKRLLKFYKDNGVKFAMVDSDGKTDILIPYWMKSGVDIIFPVEVGVWNQSPNYLRETFGENLKMMGGVNKHCIVKGEDAIREHLSTLKDLVKEGGYLPIPDHRIPPECSYEQFLTYIKVFNEVFNQ